MSAPHAGGQASGGSISFASGSHVSGSTTSGKQDRVKVAIEPDKSQNNVPPLLMDFEHSLPLTVILREVCGRWDVANPERYSFKYSKLKIQREYQQSAREVWLLD